MNEIETPRDAYAALRHVEFRWSMLATLVLSVVAGGMMTVAVVGAIWRMPELRRLKRLS